MNRARFGFGCSVASLGVVLLASACQDKKPRPKRDPAVLDRMELAAARRVGLETAVAAIEDGDLKRLQMLAKWARGRAQVIVFEPDDMKSLDLAITCLDGSLPREARAAALDEIKSGKLLKPTRDACLEEAE